MKFVPGTNSNMSPTSKTPETLSAAGRAAQLRAVSGNAVSVGPHARVANVIPGSVSPSIDVHGGEPADGTLELDVVDIDPYDNNPRISENPAYFDLKESIRVTGVQQKISVTKRPGSNRYTVAAGGNTRLRIMQELWHETGELCFKTMTVFFKPWSSESKVIVSHLVENDARGPNTFWEKARGIGIYKAERERETGQLMSAAELVKDLKQQGASYTLALVQEYLFATENLSPIGPWLTNENVRTSLRPALTQLVNLCERFSCPVGEVRRAFREIIELKGEFLRAQAQEIQNPDSVILNVVDIVQSLNAQAARQLGVTVTDIPQMLAAKEAKPRLSAHELSPAARPTISASAHASTPSDDMSSSAESTLCAAPVDSVAPSAHLSPSSPQPLPFVPVMLAPTRSAVDHTLIAADSFDALSESAGDLQEEIYEALKAISNVAQLGDVIATCSALPLGFFCELPDTSIELVGGAHALDPRLRKAAWHVLASISGQYDRRLVKQIPADQSIWRSLLDDGQLGMQYSLQVMGEVHGEGAYVAVTDLWTVFAHPVLSQHFAHLYKLAARLKARHPQRLFEQMQSIFI